MAACPRPDTRQIIRACLTILRHPLRARHRKNRNHLCYILFLILAACFSSNAQSDVAAIIRKSVQANNRDWNADPQFDYNETDKDERGTKTYQVTTILGTPYQRLVAINGKPLAYEEVAEEKSKLERAITERRAESPQKRAERISKYKAERRRDHILLAQLTKAFDFHLQGEQQIDGHDVYVLKATSRKGYRPPNRDSRVLTGMEGTLWIDKSTFQWVKVEAHVIHPVSIEGVMAKVEPGTQFELEKAPVGGGIWLTKHYAMTASAKILSVVPHHSQEDDSYFNYHKRPASDEKSSSSSNRTDSPHGSQ